jgi:hypothetical protein
MPEKSIREMLLCQREKLCDIEPIVLDSKKAEQSQQEASTSFFVILNMLLYS